MNLVNTPAADQPDSSAPFRCEELADLRAGLLTTDEQARLRSLMNHHPDRARHMIADLDAVETEFPDPPHAHEPLHVPHHVVARWQSAIAHEAERRARRHPGQTGQTGQTGAEPDSPDTIEPGPIDRGTERADGNERQR